MLKMITRSAVKKSFADNCEVSKPSVIKSTTRSSAKPKGNIQTPVIVHKDETNLGDVQLPIVNIHVHVPPISLSLNKSCQFKPVIHVHLDKLVDELSPDAILKNVKKAPEVESPSGVNSNFAVRNSLPGNLQSQPLKKNKICKKLNFSTPKKKKSANLETEKSEAVLNQIEKTEGNKESSKNSFYKNQPPTRRSVRQANNRRLLKSLKDISAKESSPTERKKSCRNIMVEKKSDSLKKTVKEPMVVLYDINEIMKRGKYSYQDDKTVEKKDSSSPVNMNACETDSVEEFEKSSCDSSLENNNEQNSENNEENKEILKTTSNDQSASPVNEKFGDVHSNGYSSDSTSSSAIDTIADLTDRGTSSDNVKINVQNKDEAEKCPHESSFDVENNSVKDAESSQSDDDAFPQLENNNKVTVEVKNDESNLLPKDKDVSLNHKNGDVNSTVSSKSNNSSVTSEDESDSDHSEPDLSQTENFEEDIHQTASPKVLDKDRVDTCLESKNNNLSKNIIEENELSSTESNGFKDVNVNTLGFQLELIRKEMKKRDMIVKEGSSRKKSLKREKTKSKVPKEGSEKSPEAKKLKLSKKITKNTRAASDAEKLSSENYLPLQVSGPTKFAVAQLSKVKPYSAHKARNFKNEMLFGNRVNRYTNPKHLQIYRLKKEAAKMRNK